MPHRHAIDSGLLFLALLMTATFTAQATPVPFADGEFVTYSQQDWGSIATPAEDLLLNHFSTLYPNGVEIGIPGGSGSSALFQTVDAVQSFLPANGVAGPLDNDYLDPSTTNSGEFGGYVLALQLNVDFDDANLLSRTSDTAFGDLILCDLTLSDFNGLTVRDFLAEMNIRLGGGSGLYTYDEIAALTDDLSESFLAGTPSQFAQEHLCLTQAEVVPEPTTAGLVLLGLLGLGVRQVRRRQQ